jgi:DNA-binding NarL/FixJ family response regulator
VGLGAAAYEQGEFQRASELIAAGLALPAPIDLTGAIEGQLRLASIAALRAQPQAAQEHMHAADSLAQRLGVPAFTSLVAARRAQLDALGGRLAAAAAWLGATTPAEPDLVAEIGLLTRALVLSALARPAESLAVADAVLAEASAHGRGRHVVDAQLLRARALAALDRPAEARAARAAAHALADPEGLVAPFRELDALALPAARHPDELTERELAVLRLIAAGLSNGAIAERLVVAPSTVKKHINRIFAKLNVVSRIEALVRARERGLML